MTEKLKKSFITGIFVLLPLWVSFAVIRWFFEEIDSLFAPLVRASIYKILATIPRMPDAIPDIPGLGILTGLVIILVLGFFARNVVGKRIFDAIERLIDRIPGYRLVYSTIKQLTDAFSPENKASFKEVVLVEHPRKGAYAIGFRTTTVDYEGRKLAVVYIGTNHLYLGDIFLIPEERVVLLDMPADQAIRMLMSAGIACPKHLRRAGSYAAADDAFDGSDA